MTRLIPRVRAVPEALAAGITALPGEGVAIFASNAVASYFPGALPTSGRVPLSAQVVASLAAIAAQPGVSSATASDLVAAGDEAADWVDKYARWLASAVAGGGFVANASVGEGNLLWFLKHVSLVNTTTWPLDRIVSLGESEFNHATTMIEVRSHADAAGSPAEPVFDSLDAQIAATHDANAEIRGFLNRTNLVTIPSWLANYSVAGIPSYLAPFDYGCLGEVDDFTQANQSFAGGSPAGFVRYVPPPEEGLPFFLDSMARDPRPVMVHEGLPGHWLQFSQSWRNSRDPRRHWCVACF